MGTRTPKSVGEEQLAEWRETSPIDTFVYFMQVESGPVKIGVAFDPIKRLAAIQNGNHEDVTLLAVIPGNSHVERALHSRFSAQHLRGEWFGGAELPVLIAYVEALSEHLLDVWRETHSDAAVNAVLADKQLWGHVRRVLHRPEVRAKWADAEGVCTCAECKLRPFMARARSPVATP